MNPAGQVASVRYLDFPQFVYFVKDSRFDTAIELHVLSQIEFVCDEVEVLEIFGLSGEHFLPVPLVEDLSRE